MTCSLRYELDFDRDRNLLRIRLAGVFDRAALMAMAETFLSRPEYTPGMSTLYLATELDMSEAGPVDFLALGDFNRRVSDRRGRARVAMVVSGKMQFGLARMYEVYGASPNIDIHIFTDEDEAERWLMQGRERPELESRSGD